LPDFRLAGDPLTSQPNPFAPHWLIRDIVIGSHLHAAGPGGLLFVGDSIVEGFYWNRIGSLAVLNAGYSGIWTEALEPKLPRLLQAAQPRLAVLLVGTNDAKKGRSESDIDEVAQHFERTIRHSEASGIPFIVVTPPPVETGKRLTSFYSVEAMSSLSRRIARIAEESGAEVIDMHRAFSGESGEARAGMTIDGIHLSAEGYRLMHDMIETKVAEVMAAKRER
jgi:lysophospholipase L1-like esterase